MQRRTHVKKAPYTGFAVEITGYVNQGHRQQPWGVKNSVPTRFIEGNLPSLKSLLFAFFWLTTFGIGGVQAQDDASGNLMLVNGRIHTLDADNSVVSSVLIRGGRIVAVGDDLQESADGVQVVDLQGRTAIPGLIDSHIHLLRAGLRPGYDMRGIESADSIAAVQAAIVARAAEVPDGAFITGIGGFGPLNFKKGVCRR